MSHIKAGWMGIGISSHRLCGCGWPIDLLRRGHERPVQSRRKCRRTATHYSKTIQTKGKEIGYIAIVGNCGKHLTELLKARNAHFTLLKKNYYSISFKKDYAI